MDIKVREAELLKIEELRRNARVDDPGEDSTLMECAAAAEEAVLNYLHSSWIELIDTYGAVPATVKKAMLSVATGMYNMPEGVDGRQQYVAPFGVLAALEGYKRLSDRSDV